MCCHPTLHRYLLEVAYPIGVGYVSGVSNFYYFCEIRICGPIRIHLVDICTDTGTLIVVCIAPHPVARTHARSDPATSARLPPPAGHRRRAPVPGSLLAGDEHRPCSPMEFPRPCNVDPAPPVSSSLPQSRSPLLLVFMASCCLISSPQSRYILFQQWS
jgi:hypothetical protein